MKKNAKNTVKLPELKNANGITLPSMGQTIEVPTKYGMLKIQNITTQRGKNIFFADDMYEISISWTTGPLAGKTDKMDNLMRKQEAEVYVSKILQIK